MPVDDGLLSDYGPSLTQLISEPLENLRLLGRRAFLALLGIAVGCMAVVALLNIGHNAQLQAMRVFKGMGTDMMVASVQLPAGSHNETAPSTVSLDTRGLISAIPGTTAVAPLISVNMDALSKGKIVNAAILGSSAGLDEALGLRLQEGRFLSLYDIENTYAVLGANVVAEWKNAGVLVTTGDRIQLGGYLFEIIGILQSKDQNPLLPVAPDNSIIVPIQGMRRIIPTPHINNVLVRNSGSDNAAQNALALQRWLEKSIPGFEVNVQVPQQLLDGMAQQSRLFSWLLAGLGGIALVVGGIGVMNVMVMNVAERRREIGVRMALGARPKDIALLFLVESVILAALGAVAGATLGLITAWLFVHYSGWASFSLSAVALPLGIGSAVTIGLFFGLSPAITASRLSPVQALRDE